MVCQGSGVAGEEFVRKGGVVSFVFVGGTGDALLVEDGMREGDVEMVGVAVPIGARVEELLLELRLLEFVITTELRRRG